MQITIEAPAVAECTLVDCAYNLEGGCHARAITVGDGLHPACDTFCLSQRHTTAPQRAGVGACKVTGCKHNQDFECAAPAIKVGRHQIHADCLTFEAR